MDNYRQAIVELCDTYTTSANDDWEISVLAGYGDVITKAEAAQIADWMDSEADSAWGANSDHHEFARSLRKLIMTENDVELACVKMSPGLG